MTALTPVDFRKGRAHEPRLSLARVPGRHSERFWSPEEDAVMRAHYPTGGVAACEAHLARIGSVKRAKGAIYLRASTLKIKFARDKGQPRQQRPELRTPEMDARIRAGWAELKGRGAVAAFAERLGIPRRELSSRALALGLTNPHKKEPPWTASEDSLISSLPLHDLRRAAAIMREHGYQRTPTAIGVRAKRLTISRRRRDVFSGTSAARLLGADSKTVTSWCIDGSLPARRRGTERLAQQGGDMWTISPADLRQFIIDNLEQIDIRRVDKYAFVDLLVSRSDAAGPPAQATETGPRQAAAPIVPRPPLGSPIASAAVRPRLAKRPLADILAECERNHCAKGVRA